MKHTSDEPTIVSMTSIYDPGHPGMGADGPPDVPKRKYRRLDQTLDIGRDQVADVCEALSDIAMQYGFWSRYVPRAGGDTCLCSYHWPLPFRGLPFGLELAFFVVIDREDRCKLRGYVWSGQDWPESQEVVLTPTEWEGVNAAAEEILQKVCAWGDGNAPKQYALRFAIGNFYALGEAGNDECRVLQTHVVDGHWVTPFSLCTRGFADSGARRRTAEKGSWLRSLIQVCTNIAPLTLKKETELIPVYKALPNAETVVAALSGARPLEQEEVSNGTDISSLLSAIAGIVSGGHLQEAPRLCEALLAYNDGAELMDVHGRPASASVAFSASLGCFVKTESCTRRPHCDVCGRDVQHQRIGEVENMMEFLRREVFEGRQWPRAASRTRLKRFYKEQRSAFVHQAKVVLGRGLTGGDAHPLGPTREATVHPALRFQEDLLLARALARLAVLSELARSHAAFEALFASVRDGFFIPAVSMTDSARLFDDKWRHFPLGVSVPGDLVGPTQGEEGG